MIGADGYRIACTKNVLAAAQEFFAERGSEGLEGTGLLACRRSTDRWWVTERFVAPDQNAHRIAGGCWVEVTDSGKRELATGLHSGELYLARIHSHPAEAFHSATDDRNPALTFDGALSIVVPFFGLGLRRGLARCASYRLLNGQWRPLKSSRAEWIREVEVTGSG